MKYNHKISIKAAVVAAILGAGILAGSISAQTSALTAIAEKITSKWPQKSCGEHITRESGYDLISIACLNDYGAREREQFLDLIFKNGFILKKETYKLQKRSGIYLYKTEFPEDSGNYVFFKLFFRDARLLYPHTPLGSGEMAVYIQDLYDMQDLVKWQTLGVPLSYGVLPFRQHSKTISEKVKAYGQELWLSLPLEPARLSPVHGRVLTIEEAKTPANVDAFLTQAIDTTGDVTGISNRLGSHFTQNVFAMRSLLNSIKDKGIENFLDTRTAWKSVAYTTAEIMSFKSYRRDYVIDHSHETAKMQEAWDLSLKKIQSQGYAVIIMHAGNDKSFQFLRDKINKGLPFRFVRISSLPGSTR